jgi:hypothetical protein
MSYNLSALKKKLTLGDCNDPTTEIFKTCNSCNCQDGITFVEGGHSGGLCMVLIFIAAHSIYSGLFKDDTSSMANLRSSPLTRALQEFGSNTRAFVNQNYSWVDVTLPHF